MCSIASEIARAAFAGSASAVNDAAPIGRSELQLVAEDALMAVENRLAGDRHGRGGGPGDDVGTGRELTAVIHEANRRRVNELERPAVSDAAAR